MKIGTLSTRRPFSKKVFIFHLLLIFPAVYAALPYALTVTSTTADLGEWLIISVASLLDVAIYGVCAAIGLYLAAHIGLGLPFVERWLERSPTEDTSRTPVTSSEEPMSGMIKHMLVFSVSVSLIFVAVTLALDHYVFSPLLQAELEGLGVTIPEIPQPVPWQGILVSFSAGINEEVMFHLCGLTVLAWLGSLVFHDADGRPTLAVLWIANILIAVLFGLAHLPITVAVGLPLTPLVIVRAVVLNGVAGILLGWLYWTRGLESAMVAHFSADIILHVILVSVL
jgi:hypothetical protein